MFCDASKQAFNTSVYIKSFYDNNVYINLVISKTRVTPLKAKSIPRLELMGATIAVRIGVRVANLLKYNPKSIIYWSDSLNVLYWVTKPSKNFKPFISNRLGEIQTVTNANQWRYCPTKENPSDIPSRGISIRNLINNSLWWHGPSFLKEDDNKWPKNLVKVSEVNKDTLEYSPSHIFCNISNVMDADFKLNPKNWSSKDKLIKRLAYVLRFPSNCLKKNSKIMNRNLESQEYDNAEIKLIKLCQEEMFFNEIKALKSGKMISSSSNIKSLNPFLDKNKILRSKSRLQNADWLNYDFKYPIILPKEHAFTNLVIKEFHEKVGHAVGKNATLYELNKKFWIPSARELIRKFVNNCIRCKMNKAKPIQQMMAPIPKFRLEPPFEIFRITGCDFAGPWMTKQTRKVRAKRYLSLFTCLQTRAVHLEVIYSLETSSFMNAFSRFIDRRGQPEEIITDNGSTFIKAEKEIRNIIFNIDDRDKLHKYRKIKWHFNPPYAANFGGVFEIMVKAAKRALYQILDKAELNDEELYTTFCHVENLLNSRPLTPVSNEINDLLPLTPNHFIHGKLNPGILHNVDKSDNYMHPTKRWKYLQVLLEHFWKRWQTEILHSYKSRNKWSKDNNLKFEKGQIVLVLDPLNYHNSWNLGRIVEVFPGPDNIVRVVDVKVGNKIYRRPINKLCPLEFENNKFTK